MTRDEKIEKVARQLQWNGERFALACRIVDALDEPVRVTDEMVKRAVAAYWGAVYGTQPGVPSAHGRTFFDDMRAALEAALQTAPQETLPDPGTLEAWFAKSDIHEIGARVERLEQERDDALTQLAMREAECEWLRRVEQAARAFVDAYDIRGGTSAPREALRAALRLRFSLVEVEAWLGNRYPNRPRRNDAS